MIKSTNNFCRFCGQAVALPNEPIDIALEITADAQEEYATRHCKCEDARKYTSIENAKEKMFESTKECEEPVQQSLSDIITLIGNFLIDEATVKVDAYDTYKIKRGSNGKLKLEIKQTDKAQIEL